MYILKEIPEEGTYGADIKNKLSKTEFEQLMELFGLKWDYQIFEYAKESKGKFSAYKRSVQNPDAFARFNYEGQGGGIRFELPKSYVGEYFELLTAISKEINGVILDRYYKPIPQEIINEFTSKEYKNLNLTRYIERSFGENSIWLCVKTEDQAGLMNKLNLTKSREDNFVDGMERSYGDGELMITNPTNGWMVIHGSDLIYTQYSNKKDYLETEDHQLRTMDFINSLSKDYEEVGFFMDGEKSNAYSAWYSKNGHLVFGYIMDEIKKEEYGDCSEVNKLLMSDPQSLSVKYCVDPIDYIYSKESTKPVIMADQECYFSIFDMLNK